MKAPTAPAAKPSSVDTFLTTLSTNNPFNDQRVSTTGVQAVDVTSIHDREFRILVSLGRRACDQNEAVGAVVWGESGSGKSNLLRRLHDSAARNGDAIVVNFLELQASPERLHRSVLNALVSLLTNGLRPPWHQTPLYTLLQGLIRPAVPGAKKLPLKDLQSLFRKRIESLVETAGTTAVTRAAVSLFEKFLIAALAEKDKRREAHAAEPAVRRLSGDALDEDEAKLVGLRPTDVSAPLDSADSVRVLALIAQIAQTNGKPVILCFDQIHTLTRQQVIDIAGLLHTINDHVRNVLLVLSEVQYEMDRLKEAMTISQATWDRITANKIDMPRLPVEQGRQILEARLTEFLKPYRSEPEVNKRVDFDALFPLGETWFQKRSAELVDVRPRHLLRIARTRWEEIQADLGKAANTREWLSDWPPNTELIPPTPPPPCPDFSPDRLIDGQVEKAITTKLSRHRASPNGLPPNADNVCGLTESLLAVGGVGLVVARAGSDSPYDLQVRIPQTNGAETTIGIAFVATGSATSVTGTLRNLAADAKPPDRVLLVTDERLPLAFGKAANAKGRTHYDALKSVANFEHVELRFEDYAALETLESIARMSADLEIDTPDGKSRPLKRDEVIASYRRGKRFESHPLLGRFFEVSYPPDKSVDLSDDEVRGFIAGRLAITMGTDTQELARAFFNDLPSERRIGRDVADCRARIEKILHTMAEVKEVKMSPLGDTFFVLPLLRSAVR
jgi:hypothetical protein